MELHEIVGLPPEPRLLGLNDRAHPQARARRVAAWRKAGWAAACAWRPLPDRRLDGKWLVASSLPVRSVNQRRDPHNFIATLKPVIDGMVDARVWPDDTSEFVVVEEPSFHARAERAAFVITLRRLS